MVFGAAADDFVTVELKVEGMMCGGCSSRIEDVIKVRLLLSGSVVEERKRLGWPGRLPPQDRRASFGWRMAFIQNAPLGRLAGLFLLPIASPTNVPAATQRTRTTLLSVTWP